MNGGIEMLNALKQIELQEKYPTLDLCDANLHKLCLEKFNEGRKFQMEKDKIVFVKLEQLKFKSRVRVVFADGSIQFFDL